MVKNWLNQNYGSTMSYFNRFSQQKIKKIFISDNQTGPFFLSNNRIRYTQSLFSRIQLAKILQKKDDRIHSMMEF